MGKNRDIESLIRLIVNTITHEIVLKNTNKPESASFLNNEVIEYRSQTEKIAKNYNWNEEDKKYVEKKALKKIKEKLSLKYSDVSYPEKGVLQILKNIINELM